MSNHKRLPKGVFSSILIFVFFLLLPTSTLAICTDNDGDGYAIEGGTCGEIDCDDSDPNVYPGATEICDGKDTNCDGKQASTDVDADGDGVAWCAGDCDDSDPTVYPGATEICDGKDNDCNGILLSTEHDSDGDGYRLCDPIPDCDDYDSSVYPGAPEICGDNKDNNCDGTIDEAGCICPDSDADGQTADFCGGTDCNDSDPNVYLGAVEDCTDGIDNDCDGLTDLADPDAVNCPVCTDNDGDGYAIDGGVCGPIDCDDSDPNVYPGAPEICDGKDSDCDGKQSSTDVDADGDGVAWCAGDCDDSDPTVYPGATEICDGKDNDCNGILLSTEHDSDGDGYRLCDPIPDCDDYDSSVYPGAPEICGDNKDNNCDGTIDEAGCICPDSDADGQTADFCGGTDCNDSDPNVYLGAVEDCTDGIDNDCDGLTDLADPDAVNCPVCTDNDGDGYAIDGGVCGPIDCDDSDPNVYPGAPEICDGKDSDCDGKQSSTDVDADGDGVAWCAGDCNDSDPTVYPGAPEICNSIDDDCNGVIPSDERDADGDGYRLCDPIPDCDDYDSSVYPGAPEICGDNKDNNCDGTIDEAGCICPDADGDGQTDAICGGTDCDDSNPNVYSGAVEDCTDGIDNDCDGLTDLADPDAVNCPVCTDNDGDGYAIDGGVCGPIDCDDSDPNVYPGAPEICDGKDSDCDGKQSSTDVDADGDGVAWCAGDCDDTNPNMFPGNQEGPYGDITCSDGIDNDCDNKIDAADSGCAAPTCTTKTTPKDGPHMFDLLDPIDDSIIKSSCDWCHYDDSGTIDQRTECQRCHADPNDPSDPLNGVLKQLYPLSPPYGFGTAPNVKLHSSTVVGTKYGNWDMDCLNCHNPHLQEQDAKYGTTYGKYIKEYICFDNTVTGQSFEEFIEFTASSGPGSFADGPPYNENICEMCHTQTNHHRRTGDAPGDLDGTGAYIGHYDGENCINCHAHTEGFKPSAAVPPPHDTFDCTVCHVTPDTYVTNADIPNSACLSCHDPSAPGTIEGGSDKKVDTHYSNTYIDPTTGQLTNLNCVECHNPMSVQINFRGNTNLVFIRDTIRGNSIVFEAYTGPYSFADDTNMPADMSTENYVCNTCHTQTKYHQNDGTAPGGQSHNDGTDCSSCHLHDAGFQPSGDCLACHNQSPPAGSTDTRRRQIVEATPGDGTGDFVRTSHHVVDVSGNTSLQVVNEDTCKVCHDQSQHTTFGDGVSVLLNDQDGGASYIFDGTGTSIEGFCVSCHDSDGSLVNGLQPFIASGDTNSPVNIEWSTGIMAHSMNDACFNCHGDASGINAHGSENVYILKYNNYIPGASQTFCYNCHDGTVSSKDIWTAFGLTYNHAAGTEDCQQCHDQHGAKSGLHVAGSTNLADMIGGVNQGLGFNYQYEICFQCHNVAITKTDLTSEIEMDTNFNGGGTYQSYWSTIPDIQSQFSITNYAYHPLFAPGRNQPDNSLNSEWDTSDYRKDDTAPGGPFNGLDNNFVDGWVSTSLVTCSDCHDNSGSGARGPHGSAQPWILKGMDTTVSVTTAGAGVIYPNQNADLTKSYIAANFCVNCHRADVYGWGSKTTPNINGNDNQKFSRVSHLGNAMETKCTATHNETGKGGYRNIGCMNCHGGGEVGGIHGSNLGVGTAGSDEMGKRFMNGNSWKGHTLGTNKTICYTGTPPAIGVNMSSCAGQHKGGKEVRTNYTYNWQ